MVAPILRRWMRWSSCAQRCMPRGGTPGCTPRQHRHEGHSDAGVHRDSRVGPPVGTAQRRRRRRWRRQHTSSRKLLMFC